MDWRIPDLVGRLKLSDDWRESLEELANHREECEHTDGKRRYDGPRYRGQHTASCENG
jgi:hypothetical protein